MKPLLLFLTLLLTFQVFGQKTDTLRIKYHYYYLADIDSQTIAELFINDDLQPSDNFITFRVLDSLTSSNKQTRKYYLPVFNKILKQSDGALSEVIGTPIVEFLKQYPTEFARTIKSDIEAIEKTAEDNFRPYTNSELIKKFLRLTAEKVKQF